MAFGALHTELEQRAGHAVGLAFSAPLLLDAIQEALSKLMANPAQTRDLQLLGSEDVAFSFKIDEASLALSADFRIGLLARVFLHPKGDPTTEIVSLAYELEGIQLGGAYDLQNGTFGWTAASDAQIKIGPETWNQEDAGLQRLSMTRDEFRERIFHGFRWITAARLLETLITALPFPQVQQALASFKLRPPFHFAHIAGYFVLWTESVELIGDLCGGITLQGPAPAEAWRTLGADKPASPHDLDQPPLALYFGAAPLVAWYAKAIAPALRIQPKRGGGFVRWSYEGWVALTALELGLQPRPDGGALTLSADLDVEATASTWIDGPCGKRLASLTATAEAKAAVQAEAALRFNLPEAALYLDAAIGAEVQITDLDFKDRLNLTIVDEIVEALVRCGAIQIKAGFNSRTHAKLLGLADLDSPFDAHPLLRVGEASTLIGLNPNTG